MAKQCATATPTTTTLTSSPSKDRIKPGIYEVQLQSQKSLVIVLDEQSTAGPVLAIRFVRSAHNARLLKPVGVGITADHAEVLKLFAQCWPID